LLFRANELFEASRRERRIAPWLQGDPRRATSSRQDPPPLQLLVGDLPATVNVASTNICTRTKHIRAAIHQRSTGVMPKQKSTGKRTTIKPKGDARYIRRDSKGRIKESDDVGRSQKKDREQKAKKKVRPGYGDRGDQKRR
jgi:hypothetical protein